MTNQNRQDEIIQELKELVAKLRSIDEEMKVIRANQERQMRRAVQWLTL